MGQALRVATATVIALTLVWTTSPAWSASGAKLLNVNTADTVQLQALPGIGPKKAEAIVLYRASNGPFRQIDDLILVKGIGPKTLEKLRPLVTVGKQRKARSRASSGGPG
jgi:competence protein ComEA